MEVREWIDLHIVWSFEHKMGLPDTLHSILQMTSSCPLCPSLSEYWKLSWGWWNELGLMWKIWATVTPGASLDTQRSHHVDAQRCDQQSSCEWLCEGPDYAQSWWTSATAEADTVRKEQQEQAKRWEVAKAKDLVKGQAGKMWVWRVNKELQTMIVRIWKVGEMASKKV